MSIVLYLDTATNRLMLGLSQEQSMRMERIIPCESHRYHSAMLIPAIQEMMAEAGLDVRALTALAVNLGPGSFTGIRTGITTVRTMGQFLDLPIYGFNAFELITCGHEKPVSVYLDALRGRSYHAVLKFGQSGVTYEVPPVLRQLQPGEVEVENGHALYISASLSPFFEGRDVHFIDESVSTPGLMHQLMQRYEGFGRRTWQETRPLYIQEPSITLKKSNRLSKA